jgi:beta-galactosidase GanA
VRITPADGKRHEFSFGGKEGRDFLLDGKPFQIRSGEMHPQRIPKEYWAHRVAMARAMGLNTIAFYAMWNDFEQSEGTFDFKTGNRDIAGFLRVCQDEGMWVLFRPGPYVCGEWDFGGIPSRLLKHADLKIRTLTDERFMAAQTEYLKAIAAVASPFRASERGPILMTQLENEYGSYQRKEHDYMLWLMEFWTKQGFGPFYTADGAAEHYLKGVVIPGVAVGLDSGENAEHWATAHRMNPGVPAFSSET